MNNFISRYWPSILVMVSIGVISFYDGDIQAILIYVGALIILGGAALNDKLTKLQDAPEVLVEVQIQINLRDDILEFEYLNKLLTFTIMPRIGDQITDNGEYIGKVEGVNLRGMDDEMRDLGAKPEASVWCKREVGNAETMQEVIADFKEQRWRTAHQIP